MWLFTTPQADFEAFVSHEGNVACDAAARGCNVELGGFITVAEEQGAEPFWPGYLSAPARLLGEPCNDNGAFCAVLHHLFVSLFSDKAIRWQHISDSHATVHCSRLTGDMDVNKWLRLDADC
jgi:hypothetical protein